ncbi:MAG: rhodanese-like domain-containing protein [Ilumatobacteraceae bacterium]
MRIRTAFISAVLAASSTLAACGDDAPEPVADTAAATTGGEATGLVTVSPEQGAATIADSPDGLVILDVRTPEEFADGHLEGAVLVDFYEPSFAEELAALDPTVPYVLYCRSGNRSGQTLAIMDDLGFEAVEDLGGGIVAWEAAGLPVTTD